MSEQKTQETLEKAFKYFDEILENPDKVIKIKPSFEWEYIKNLKNK